MERSLKDLLARRDELQSRMAAIHHDLAHGIGKDYEDQAIRLENLEALQETARVAKKELREVKIELAGRPQSTAS